jgi:biopolymer transport protein ExbD
MRFIASDGEVAKSLNLPLVPMIDVFMNLLCFFLIAGHFKEVEREIASNLPKEPGVPTWEREIVVPELWVQIKNGGDGSHSVPRVVVDGRLLGTWDDVERTLTLYARVPGLRDQKVVVAPEPNAEHGWVMRVLGILQEQGFRDIAFKR